MKQEMFHIHPLTAATIQLQMMGGDEAISVATGFLWEEGGQEHLVTNWHNVTGVNPLTGAALDKKYGARPDFVQLPLMTTGFGLSWTIKAPLYDAQGGARWRIHPVAGEQVDIAVLPLDQAMLTPSDPRISRLAFPMNKQDLQSLKVQVSEDLFVIGFPQGLHQNGMPIWKRASLASEPAMFRDQRNHRQLLIDCASRKGMSGSPVIAIHRSTIRRSDGVVEFSNGEGIDFLGIYSGRLVDKEEDRFFDDFIAAQIGIVWPRALVERVVKHGVRDKFTRGGSFEPTTENV